MRKTGILLAAALACAGCGPDATRPAVQGNPEQHAEELAAAKDYQQAAGEYLRLARLYSNRESHYQLLAAQSYLNGAETETAASLLQEIDARSRIEAAHRELLRARLALLQHHPAEALSFSAEADRDAPEWLQVLRHTIRAAAYEESANLPGAIRERITLTRHPAVQEPREANLDSLWSDLNSIDRGSLRGIATGNDPALQGWIELTEMNRDLMGKTDVLRSALASWVDGHASHAAVPFITGKMLSAAERFHVMPQHIALLLPLSGQFDNAAAAIRDGFLAAWYAQDGSRPVVTIYDANSLNIVDQYQKAVAAGADFVVGPLEKGAVGSLLQANIPMVPTLALNRHELTEGGQGAGVEHGGMPELIQFGLAPEDEAQLAAQRAHADGYSRALVISAGNDWGRRLSSAFQNQWQALGGRILEHVEYQPGGNDFSADARELLNVDSSDARAAALRQQIGRPLHSGARLREDADVIFMAAIPVNARQIIPQLRFFGADQIPVYSSSHVYTGAVDPQSDSDMNDVRFPDMPWILDPESAAPALEQGVIRNWPADSSATQRLYAFGADAFRLIPQIGRLVSQEGASMHGLTGELHLSADGIIQRKLMWAQFVDGSPRLLDPVNTP